MLAQIPALCRWLVNNKFIICQQLNADAADVQGLRFRFPFPYPFRILFNTDTAPKPGVQTRTRANELIIHCVYEHRVATSRQTHSKLSHGILTNTHNGMYPYRDTDKNGVYQKNMRTLQASLIHIFNGNHRNNLKSL